MNLFRQQIEEKTRYIRDEQFVEKEARVIPTIDSSDLTFNNVGKAFYATILYIDIRHSSQLLEAHRYATVAKLLSAYYNAIVDFSCGIGIDYGMMSVLKVGIDRRDDEQQENKNLVWVDYPANYASRLTDVANKIVMEQYRITGIPMGSRFVKEQNFSKDGLLSILRSNGNALTPIFHQTVTKIESIEHTFHSILVSEAVYNGYASALPNDECIVNNWWHLEDYPIKDINYKVYGTDVLWME